MDDKRYPTRQDIDRANDHTFEDVPTPELGENAFVRVATMTGDDRDSLEQHLDEHGKKQATAALLVRCLVDPATGRRIYGDDELEVLGKRGRWLTRAWRVAVRLNAIRSDSVETVAKN